jgi:hypothetical protein
MGSARLRFHSFAVLLFSTSFLASLLNSFLGNLRTKKLQNHRAGPWYPARAFSATPPNSP